MSFVPVIPRSSKEDLLWPEGAPLRMVQGFAVTTAIGLLSGAAPGAALLRGALAMLATLVEMAVRPLIRALLPNYPWNWAGWLFQVTIPTCVALGAGYPLACAIGPSMEKEIRFASLSVFDAIRFVASFWLNPRDWYDRGQAAIHIL